MTIVWHSFLGIVLLLSLGAGPLTGQDAPGYTPPYPELIAQYQQLAAAHPEAQLRQVGPTDAGRPLQLFVIGGAPVSGELPLESLAQDKTVLLINNGIHPGEPCGINASLPYARQWLERGLPQDFLVAIIPAYNVGGALNRGPYSRANQRGPAAHGFRGNARNLDLNRDFIKADARNTWSFYRLFHALDPHIFVDTHTSNGADYRYTMTLISTQADKLMPAQRELLYQKLRPALYQDMENRGWPMIPYVNVFGRTPQKGYAAFLETPRYSTGYTALHHCLGFVTETHMLKPFADRVASTEAFLHSLTQWAARHGDELERSRQKAREQTARAHYQNIAWQVDSNQADTLSFKGYAAARIPSKLGPYQRLQYQKDQPRTWPIPWYHRYQATDSARLPRYYVLPQAWREVVRRLKANGVAMQRLEKDTSIALTSIYLKRGSWAREPYEGHFPLRSIATEERPQKRLFLAGDYLIAPRQQAQRFIVHALEPRATDSYLRWNFFDAIFQQKEHFSPYVFEETAAQLLKENPALAEDFKQWQSQNPQKAEQAYPSLKWIYRHSPYYEAEHRRYPVGKIY